MTAEGRLFAVIGHPVAHSLSPAMHAAGFAAAGRDARYVTIDVPPERLAAELAAFPGRGLAGCNVTVPLKEAAAALATRRTPDVARTGSANTLSFSDGQVCAASTDGPGFLAAMRQDADWLPEGKSVVLLGAGGAARAIAAALLLGGAAVAVANRTRTRAEALAARLADLGPIAAVAASGPGLSQALAAADLVVNATTLGMHGQGCPLDGAGFEALRPGAPVCDIVYVPERTPLLQAAERSGHPALGGLGMLAWQAALSWEVWFGRPGPVDVFLAAARDALHRRG